MTKHHWKLRLFLALILMVVAVTATAHHQSAVQPVGNPEQAGRWMRIISPSSRIDPETGLRVIAVMNPFSREAEEAYYSGTPLPNRHLWVVEGWAYVLPRRGSRCGGIYLVKMSLDPPPQTLFNS